MAALHNLTKKSSIGLNGKAIEEKGDSDIGFLGKNEPTSIRTSQRLKAMMEGKIHYSVETEPKWSEKQAGQTLGSIDSGFLHIASSIVESCNEESIVPQAKARDVVYNLRSKTGRNGASTEPSSTKTSPGPAAPQRGPPSELQTQTLGAKVCSSAQEDDAVQYELGKSLCGRVAQLLKLQPEQVVACSLQNSHISYGQVLTDAVDMSLSRTRGGARKRTALGKDNELARREDADYLDQIGTLKGQQHQDGWDTHNISEQVTNRRLKRGDAGVAIPRDKMAMEKNKKANVEGKYMCTECGMLARNASITKYLLIA